MQDTEPELRVEVRQLGNRFVATTEDERGREILSHEFQHETTGLTYLGPLWLVDQDRLGSEDRHRLNRAPQIGYQRAQAASQGQLLFRYLFGDGKALTGYLKPFSGGKRIPLTLTLGQSSESLWRLPWEYLYDGRRFPCLEGDLLLSRRPLGLERPVLEPSAAPLRVLAIIAAPEDLPGFSTDEALGVLQDALGDLIRLGALELDMVSEPTPRALLECLEQKAPHVVHFIGHGTYHLTDRQGFLCFEDDMGRSELISGAQLPRFLESATPGVLIVTACPSAQVGILDAFQGVAADLLQSDVPGVLTIPVSLSTASATAFYQALYGHLSRGYTLLESLHAGRAALKHADERLPETERVYDWGVPALYQRSPRIRPIDAATLAAPESSDRPAGQGKRRSAPTALLVGRNRELQATRRALREGANVFHLRGSAGVGKSRLMARILTQVGPKPAGTLVIRCFEMPEPLTVLASIAGLWRSEAQSPNDQAADLLLNAHRDPFERARDAQRLIAKKRFFVLFEGIDAWFRATDEDPDLATIDDDVLRKVLIGLVSEPSRTVFFFTGERRWADLATLSPGHRREIYLPLLTLRPALQVMQTWQPLRTLSLQEQRAVHWHVGGHPKAYKFLAGLLSFGDSLTAVLEAAPVGDRSTEAWIAHLAGEILDRLDPGELKALTTVAFLRTAFSATDIAKLTHITTQHAAPLADRWESLGLLERAGDWSAIEPTYAVDFIVRAMISARLSPPEAAAQHLQVATFYGAPFIDAARRQVLARNITSWSEDRIAWLARDANGILGLWLRKGDDGGLPAQDRARDAASQREQTLQRALAWQHHLTQAGQFEAALQIVQAIVPELNRQGQRELAKSLLQRAIARTENDQSAAAVEYLGKMGLEQGPLTAALSVYEELLGALDPQTDLVQRAHVLIRAGGVHERLGNYAEAIRHFHSALEIARRASEARSEAECLYRLATAYREAGDLRQALVASQAAKERYEALGYPYGLAAVEREQGQILKELGRLESALARFTAGLKICRSLGDQQCIADSLTEIGLLFEKLGRTETAIQVLEEALEHYDYLRGPEHGKVLSLLGRLYTRKQQLDEAVAKFRTARRAARSQN